MLDELDEGMLFRVSTRPGIPKRKSGFRNRKEKCIKRLERHFFRQWQR